MRLILAVVPALLAIVGQSQMAFSKQPLSKGKWTYKSGKPQSVTFDYGTELTIKDIDQLSRFTTITRIVMGYAGVDSEYVTIEGDLRELRRLINLEELHLCKDGINDDDLRFIASLPKIHTLEFNADNGYDGAPSRVTIVRHGADHWRPIRFGRRNFPPVIHDGNSFVRVMFIADHIGRRFQRTRQLREAPSRPQAVMSHNWPTILGLCHTS